MASSIFFETISIVCGLCRRQPSSGGIAPGNSKAVTFIADHSFTFQPYWFQSGVKKDYLVTVTVN